jgi:PIN domain nuclease of toxin-antitoxin system
MPIKTPTIQTILLDTHCWIWIQAGAANRFAEAELLAIEAAAREDALAISVISVWEVAMLEAKKRIEFDRPCWAWIEAALRTPGQQLIPITPRVAFEASRLPGSMHADPADRMIAATARNMGARLLTRDQKLLDYAAEGHLQIL